MQWCMQGSLTDFSKPQYEVWITNDAIGHSRFIVWFQESLVWSSNCTESLKTWSDFSAIPMTDISHLFHYSEVLMSAMVSQITSFIIVYSTVYSGTDQRKHQSSASLAFVQGIQRWPVNFLHKGPVTWKMFPFDNVIMSWGWDMACFSCVQSLIYILPLTCGLVMPMVA